MRKKNRISIATTSLVLLSAAGAAWADSAPAKPAVPSLSDIFTASGLTATGYVDATYGYSHNDSLTEGPAGCGCKTDYNSFALNQAGLTLAMQPASGFGALVNVVAGSTPYSAIGDGSLVDIHNSTLNQSGTTFNLMQAFAQYITGAWTLQAGKFATLAGAEVFNPNGNTNVTRSILFNYEPVTHTGVRATFAVNGMLNLILGVNNGWTGSQELSDGSDKTLEAGLALTPNKMISWTLQGYYGRDNLLWTTDESTVKGQLLLLDSVFTWNATSALTVIGTADYGNAGSTYATPSASWWGIAGYVNYAINDQWRVSLRGEYFDDTDGYQTGAWTTAETGGTGETSGTTSIATKGEKLQEVTLTFGYDPTKNFEFRIEGRADFPSPSYSSPTASDYLTANYDLQVKTYQGWLEGMYHF